MSDKLAVIILDALDSNNLRKFNLERIEELYEERNSEVLGISTLPHTAVSNPMIWGGYENNDKYLVEEPAYEWTDPARGFSRDKGEAKGSAERCWRRSDFKTTFIWDDLTRNGYNATAIHIPIVLPPYNFNTSEDFSTEDFWFPDNRKRMAEHVERLPGILRRHADEDYDFIAASIQMPDKWLHGLAEAKCDEEFVDEQAEKLDKEISKTVEKLENEDFEWIILGDHGSPKDGAIKAVEQRQLLPRHRKQSVIIGTLEKLPRYTSEVYKFILDYFEIEETDFENVELEISDKQKGEVKERLKNLGYL